MQCKKGLLGLQALKYLESFTVNAVVSNDDRGRNKQTEKKLHSG